MQIRVGLKFLGNTTVTARSPPQLEQAGSYTQLSLYFKTTQSDALLAYVGGQRRAENLQVRRAVGQSTKPAGKEGCWSEHKTCR